MGGKSSKGSSTSTVSQVSYSPEQKAFMAKALEALNASYPQFVKSAYPGAAPVKFSNETLAAMNYLRAAAPVMQQVGNAQLGALQFGLHDVLFPSTNPAVADAISAAITPIKQEYLDPNGVFSQIRGGAAEAGQYGGTRQGVAEGIAAGRYGQAIGDTAAKISSDAYGQGLDAFTKILGLSPAIEQSTLLPAQMLASVGGQQEALGQQIQNYNAASRMWNLTKSADALNQFAPIVWGAPTGSMSTSTSGGSSGGSVLGNVVGGALSLGGSSMMQGAMSAMGLPGVAGYALGAVLGGLFG